LMIMMLITLAYVLVATALFKIVEKRARTTGTMVEA
jgi:hypothetical protein